MSSNHPLLHIDLDALGANYTQLQQRLSSGRCGAVVKANAYGLGAEPVARALYHYGCRDFFVASVEEGIQLRTLLPASVNVLVLQGCEAGEESVCTDYGLTPVLISLPMAERYLAYTNQRMDPGNCVIKLNTGMNRLGLNQDEFTYLLRRPQRLRQARLQLLLSHLACADEPEHPLNAQQLTLFRQALTAARQELPALAASLANSAGVMLGADYHFDLVRPGAALYGINPGKGENPMRSVVTLRLRVAQLRDIQKGESVGYGASYRAPGPRRLAVVSGGYADGLLRALNGDARGYWAGQWVPLVGRVSMDSLIFDVTELTSPLAEGDHIEIIGPHTPVDVLASAANTIGYELFTRLGERCQRRYSGGLIESF